MTNDNRNTDEIDRLTQGTLTNGDIPDQYEEPNETFRSYLKLFDGGVMISEPDHSDTTFTIHPESVPERGTVSIDFFYGRPVIYLYSPLEEEPPFIFALPTKDDPHLRPLRIAGVRQNAFDRIQNSDED